MKVALLGSRGMPSTYSGVEIGIEKLSSRLVGRGMRLQSTVVNPSSHKQSIMGCENSRYDSKLELEAPKVELVGTNCLQNLRSAVYLLSGPDYRCITNDEKVF